MKTRYSVLGYRTDLYFQDYRRGIEVYEYGHNDRNIHNEIERQEAIVKNLVENLLKLVLMKKVLIFLML